MQTKNISQATETCEKIMEYISTIGAGVFPYDSRIYGYDWVVSSGMRTYLTSNAQKEQLYKAIHIDGSTKVPIYATGSDEVAKAYDFEEWDDYTEMFSYIIKNNIATLIYAGEFDMQDGPTTMVWIDDIEELFKRDADFQKDARKQYVYFDKD